MRASRWASPTAAVHSGLSVRHRNRVARSSARARSRSTSAGAAPRSSARLLDRPARQRLMLGSGDLVDVHRVPERRGHGGALGRVAVVVLDGVAQLVAGRRILQGPDPGGVVELQHPVPGGDRQVVEVGLVEDDGAVEGPGDEHRVDGRAGVGGPVEEHAGRVPRRGGRIDLVAASEALDDHRQPARRGEPDQVLLVGRVETADGAGRQERDRAPAGPARGRGEGEQLVGLGDPGRDGPVVEVEVGTARRTRTARPRRPPRPPRRRLAWPRSRPGSRPGPTRRGP